MFRKMWHFLLFLICHDKYWKWNLDDIFGDVRIVSGLAKSFARLGLPELEVRHVDVHQTVEKLKQVKYVKY